MASTTESIQDVDVEKQQEDHITVDSNNTDENNDNGTPNRAWLTRGALMMVLIAVVTGVVCLVVFLPKPGLMATTTSASTSEKTAHEVLFATTTASDAKAALTGDNELPPFNEDILKGYVSEEDFMADAASAIEKLAFQKIKRNVESNFGPDEWTNAHQDVSVAATKSGKTEPAAKGRSGEQSGKPPRTNTVEATVDEADLIKADQHFVYASFSDVVLVWDREGNKIAELEMPVVSSSHYPDDDYLSSMNTTDDDYTGYYEPKAYIDAMLITEDYLIVSANGFASYDYEDQHGANPELLRDANNLQVRVYTKPTPSDKELRLVGKKSLHGYFIDARFMEERQSIQFVTSTDINLYEALERPLDSLLYVSAQGIMPPSEYIARATTFAKDKLVPAVVEKLRKEFTQEGMSKFLRINGWVPENSLYTADDSAITTFLQVTSLNVKEIERPVVATTKQNGEDEPELPVTEAAMLAPYNPKIFGSDDYLVLSFDRYFWDEKTGKSEDHVFVVTFDVATSKFTSVGTLTGLLTDEHSLDIQGTNLRVASTVRSSTDDFTQVIDNYIISFDMSIEMMTERGRVAIGKPLEVIQSVRFGDNFTYAVTFDQQDPFYVIDFPDGVPTVQGIVELPGYSSYLISLSATEVLGIGQNVTGEGFHMTETGLLINLFDVSNPAEPTVRASYKFDEDVDSEALWKQYKSVQYKDGKLTIPISSYTYTDDPFVDDMITTVLENHNNNGEELQYEDSQSESFNGFVVLDVSNGIRELFRIDHTGNHEGCNYCSSSGMPPRSFMYDDGAIMTVRNDIAVYSNFTSGVELWRMDLTLDSKAADCCW